jgi:murein DD-endopeptidase MepM/ murein hydrolase activator NlpD
VSFSVGNWWNNTFHDSGSEYAKNRKKIIFLANKLDSLEQEVVNRDALIENFRKIVTGDAALAAKADAKAPASEVVKPNPNALDSISAAEEALRLEFEQSASLEGLPANNAPEILGQIFFFKPVEGFVSSEFDARIAHFGMDIAAKQSDAVKSVADGTVIVSSWTQDAGHVIAVQHRSNLISLYKHNASLTRKVGDAVKAGDVIALVGNSGEQTTGTHLHLEIWYNGNAINPRNLIAF